MSQETIRAAEHAAGQVKTMSTYDLDSDQLHEECGIFGVWAPDRDVARLTYFGLRALQHRGQESAGIAVGDGGTVMVRKDLGLLDRVFSNADLSTLSGQLAVGHVRYGTAGAKSWEASQPHLSTINSVIIALAHNGTLVNTDELRRQLIELGVPFLSNSDSEVATKLIGYFTQRTGHLREGIRKTMELVRGGYAMTLINEQALYAFRDPHGIRPLVLGKLVDDPTGSESGRVQSLRGLGLLPTRTVFSEQKRRTQVTATVTAEPFAGAKLTGYEIHTGRTVVEGTPFDTLADGQPEGCVNGSVFGTYLHGLFDTGELTEKLTVFLCKQKGIAPEAAALVPMEQYRQQQFDLLADGVRGALDMAAVYRAMGMER